MNLNYEYAINRCTWLSIPIFESKIKQKKVNNFYFPQICECMFSVAFEWRDVGITITT